MEVWACADCSYVLECELWSLRSDANNIPDPIIQGVPLVHYRVLGVGSLRIQGPVEREYLNSSGQAGQSDDAIEGRAPRCK